MIESGNEFLTNVVAVAGEGLGRGLILKSDGTLFGFGLNFYLGKEAPAGLSNVVSIEVEGDCCWAIKRDGTVAEWGSDKDEANVVGGLSNVTSIVWAGGRSYLALKSDGTVLGFRLNPGGPPKGPAAQSAIRPVKVGGQLLSNVVALSSRRTNPMALMRDGTVYSLRFRAPGVAQTQPPYEYALADPLMADGKVLSNVVAIASGLGPARALRGDGTVVSLGNDCLPDTATPAGLSNVIAIAVDEHITLALKRDGTVAAWGDYYSGQTSVPAGLSNVVAIAAGLGFNLALTTGPVPTSVYLHPHGRLEEMAAKSDLVFKGQVLSSTPITNAAFQVTQMNVDATKLKVISVLKGHAPTNILVFEHYSSLKKGGFDWDGPSPPACLDFEVGQTYIVFAANLNRPDMFYAPSPDLSGRPDEFRQLYGDSVTRTLDARPLNGLTIKDAHWFELNLLLKDANPTNALYAINKLDALSLAGRDDDRWSRSDVFKRKTVLDALLPLVTHANDEVAIAALHCFQAGSDCSAQIAPFADTLVQIASNGSSIPRRVAAIAALSGTKFLVVSNALPQ